MLWSPSAKSRPAPGLADTAGRPRAVPGAPLQPSTELKRAFPLKRCGLRAVPSRETIFPLLCSCHHSRPPHPHVFLIARCQDKLLPEEAQPWGRRGRVKGAGEMRKKVAPAFLPSSSLPTLHLHTSQPLRHPPYSPPPSFCPRLVLGFWRASLQTPELPTSKSTSVRDTVQGANPVFPVVEPELPFPISSEPPSWTISQAAAPVEEAWPTLGRGRGGVGGGAAPGGGRGQGEAPRDSTKTTWEPLRSSTPHTKYFYQGVMCCVAQRGEQRCRGQCQPGAW